MPRDSDTERTLASQPPQGAATGKAFAAFLHVGPRGELTAHSREELPVRQKGETERTADSQRRPAVLFTGLP